MCLAQGHNTVTLVRLEPAAPRSRVKHSTTEPLRSLGKRSFHCHVSINHSDLKIFFEKAVHEAGKESIVDDPGSGPEVIKLFFVLNSTEHEISTAHKN